MQEKPLCKLVGNAWKLAAPPKQDRQQNACATLVKPAPSQYVGRVMFGLNVTFSSLPL